jgi:hypothetical protein
VLAAAPPAVAADLAPAGPGNILMAKARPVATIDFFGARTLDTAALRKALPLHEGDLINERDFPASQLKIMSVLKGWPKVAGGSVGAVCCAAGGGMHVFIGVREKGSRPLTFRPAPTGTVRLPAALAAADAAAWQAVFKALAAGQGEEDRTEGHALSKDPQARALQEKLPPLAAQNLPLLREVLRESADGEQRALAARLLGYAPDKQAVVKDLVDAVSDPYPGVRNDAVRALAVFTYMTRNPPRVPYEPFVALLDSSEWSDLNKASLTLAQLSDKRDPALLALLRARALPALVSVARWRDRDHSQPAYYLLGRVAGLPDAEIQTLWNRGDSGAVIRAALRKG